MNSDLGLDGLPAPLRDRRNQIIAVAVLAVVVIVILVLALRPGDDGEKSTVSASSASYLGVGCYLNDQASKAKDPFGGSGTSSLMAEAQLLGAGGHTDSGAGSFTGFGTQLALTTQRKDAHTLHTLLPRIGTACKDVKRTEATPGTEAKLACAAADKLASDAPTPKKLGSSQGASWAQLRAMRYVGAAAATGDKAYTALDDAAAATYLAAAQPDPKGYADGLKSLDEACGKI